MKTYSITDVGKRREMNQDYVFASDQPVGNLPNLLIVADGMGGHKAGDLASRYAVETMVEYIRDAKKEERPIPLLGAAIHTANDAVAAKAKSSRDLEGMGTTVVAAAVQGEYLYIANVGDSRLYLIDREIEQITRDHSLVEEMIRVGELKREDARKHPDRNVITRAVGVHTPVKIDFFDVKLERGDIILLCSDGLTNMVEDPEILRIVRKSSSLKEAAQKLVNEANKNGGKDNISVVLAEF
ncbi:MAG: Stp1/IreP family PP2C-type Ser/Thr phosphatase [Lachnospiraceae bacterium]|nr:Stp1/IreP family PP2C-type Ser/Thr phosphatase [Lachnospiraceae bacterium]